MVQMVQMKVTILKMNNLIDKWVVVMLMWVIIRNGRLVMEKVKVELGSRYNAVRFLMDCIDNHGTDVRFYLAGDTGETWFGEVDEDVFERMCDWL